MRRGPVRQRAQADPQSRGRPGPLPGSTSDGFFEAWLEHGTGGTCWAGNGALHDLLEALGFDVARAIATMLPSPEIRGPNHGTVIVTVDGERWIADASILSGEPIRIPAPAEPAAEGQLPRFEWLDGQPGSASGGRWRHRQAFRAGSIASAPTAAEWDALHQRTGALEPVQLPAQREGDER